jgi:porphobilinogen synthase
MEGQPTQALELTQRPRRNRRTAASRALMRETSLSAQHLILPLFVVEGENRKIPINAMPGCARLSVDLIVAIAKEAAEVGVSGVALFPAIDDSLKTKDGRESWNASGLLQRCVKALKAEVPDILVITDVALDPYSSDGHDGYVTEEGIIDNDITVPLLCKMAVAQAEAGADVVAPSDMMDGRVGAIRKALDEKGFTHVAICSYCVKYASSFYGPFREALDSAPRGGDKKTYQMDPANRREALREVKLDEQEGADWLMVKPGLPYLDVIREVKQHTSLPVAAYHVSGEFAMLKAAAAQGWINYDDTLLESLLSLRRAGADIIFTYGAIDAGRLLQDKKRAKNYQ